MKRCIGIILLICAMALVAANYTTTTQAPIPLDGMSGAAIVVDHQESFLHQGKMFHAHYESDPTDSNLIGEETAISFITPAAASGRVHLIIDVRADEESVWELREDPTITLNNETPLLAFNRFRDSTNTSGMIDTGTAPGTTGRVSRHNVAEAAAADLSGGTILEHETIAIAGGPPFGGVGNAEERGEREWILMAETEYVIILTCSSNNNTTHEISLTWYEHTTLVY